MRRSAPPAHECGVSGSSPDAGILKKREAGPASEPRPRSFQPDSASHGAALPHLGAGVGFMNLAS